MLGVEPNTQVELYAFNHDTVEWYIYGYGRVSSDGKTINPEINPNTGQRYGLIDFSWHYPNAGKGGNPGGGGGDSCPGSRGANPVDYSTGIKYEEATDVSFGGSRGGITLIRSYSSDNSATATIGRFGRGWKDNYEIRLSGSWVGGGAGSVIRPDEQSGRLFSYNRTDTDGSLIFTGTETVSQLADSVRKLTNGTLEYRYGSGMLMRFDSSGKLTAMTDRNGNTTTLTYSGSNLTQITDPVGRAITFEYDGSGKVVRVTDPLNRSWIYGYSDEVAYGILSSVTNPLGHITRYNYSIPSGIRLSSIVDSKNNFVKRIIYDDQGRVISQRFADDGIETYQYQSSGSIITQTAITDPLGRKMVKRFNANGYVIEQTDGLEQKAKIERNLINNLSTSTVGSCGCLESSKQYDGRGNATSLTNQLGETNQFEFEPKFNNLTKITDKSGKITTFTYDDNGNLTSSTNPLNQTSSITYSQFGQVTGTTDALGHTTQIEYDNFGNTTATVNSLGERTTFEYDEIGRLRATVDPLGRRSERTYDELGRVKTTKDASGAITTFGYDANSNLIRTTNADGKVWSNRYDSKNRPIEQKNSLGFITLSVYNKADEVVETISAENRKTAYLYTPRGQVETVTDPLGNTTRMTYDYRKRLVALTDQRNNTTTFVYDELSRPVSMRDALGRTATVKYDAAGNISEKIDAIGSRMTFVYDRLDRAQTVNYADASVTSNYDANGRLTSLSDTQGGTINWTYDNADRVLTEQTAQGTISYGYTTAGQRASMTASGQPTVSYGYDAAGRLASISQSGETFGYGYDSLSRLTSMTRPNGVNTTYGYDALDRLTRMTHGAIEDYRYAYTPDNQTASISSLNSTAILPTAKTAGAANQMNQVSQFGNANYNFDEKGQTTTKTNANGTAAYNWDSRGRLTAATLPNGQTVNYSYDALGRRSSRTTNNQTTNFIYDGADVIQDKQGTNQTDYLNGGLDEKLKVSSNQTGSLYFLTDHLGSTQGLTGTSGNVAEWQRYTSFGESDVSNTLTRYGFTGREKDSDTNLIYYRARWYDAEQGRFISQDPIGFAGGNTNLYSYVSNNPVSKTDPLGLYEIDTHYYLTEYLAKKTGCFTDPQSKAIANGNQLTDELDEQSPGLGKTYQNSRYHALHKGAQEGVGSAYLWDVATFPGPNFQRFGTYLHYLQDTFSHKGFPNSNHGHVRKGHFFDKTNSDPARAVRMAKSTWDALIAFAKTLGCKCNPTWTPEIGNTIVDFATAPGSDTPTLNSIDSTGGYLDTWIRNAPWYLNSKRDILGLSPR